MPNTLSIFKSLRETKKPPLLLPMYFALTLLFSCSCTREESVPNPPELKVIVTDQHDQPVAKGKVILFKDKSAWDELKNPVAVNLTDEYGKATFKTLESMRYYIYAEKGQENNRYGIGATKDALKDNVITSIRIKLAPVQEAP